MNQDHSLEPAQAPPPPSTGLVRVLGPFSATCIVIGAIIGVGIFFNPSQVARTAGSAPLALTAWGVGGLIAMLGALTFAGLGQMYPRNAGQYEILRDAFGHPVGFLYVFCNATAIQTGAIAIIAAICANYVFVAATGESPGHIATLTLGSILILGLAFANGIGVKWGSGIQNLTVVIKVSILLIVTLLAVLSGPATEPHSTITSAAGEPMNSIAESAPGGLGVVATLFAAIVPAFFAFGGWQHALWIGGEVRDARRTLPRAIIGGVLLVAIVYLLTNWAFFRLLGYEGVVNTKAIASDAVARVWPDIAQRTVAGAVAISAFGVLNAQLLSGPRLVLGMAQDGRFFSVFGRAHPRFHTPIASIGLLCGLGMLLLLVAGQDVVDRLVTGVVMVDSVFFAATGLALIILRRRMPSDGASNRPPLGYPWAPILFVLGELGLVFGSYWDPANRAAALIGAAWIAGGLVLYATMFRRPSA